ncbi:MAG: site-2 protease family protein [Planctomycetota bacterium]|jgi:Zn-dependent protease
MNWEIALVMMPGLVVGLTLPEFAHAWTASLLGDDFARRQGRVSLNPLRHLSPLGTLALLVLPFGWGRPVPINLYNFRRPCRDYLLVSLAGPLANLLVAAVCLGLMQWTRHTLRYDGWGGWALEIGHFLLSMTVVLNVVLATVNLIPIPPLDGSKIWPCLVPGVKPAGRARTTWVFLVVLVVLLYTGSLRPVVRLTVQGVAGLMSPTDSQLVRERTEAAHQALSDERWTEAEKLYSEALAIDPRSHVCLYGRAIARCQQRQWQGALADIDRALEMHDDRDYRTVRAQIFQGREGAVHRE